MLLFAQGSNSNATTILRPCMGFTAGSTQNFAVGYGADNKTTTIDSANATNTFRRARNDYCLALSSSGSSTYPLMKLSSFTGDGAHWTYDNNDSGAWNISYIAFGGSDIVNAKAGSFNLNSTTGNQDIDVGFQPDVVFFLGSDSEAPPAGAANSTPHLSLYLGAAKNASNEGVMCLSSVDNLTSAVDAGRYQRSDRCIAFFTAGGAVTQGDTSSIEAEAEYVGPINTASGGGFRINVLNAPLTSHPVFYLAIQGGSWNVGAFSAPTSNQSQTVTVPDAHTPKGLFVFGFSNGANTAVTNDLSYTVGAATSSTSEWALFGRDDDGATINNSCRGSTTDAVVRTVLGASNAINFTSTADFTSFAANQFTINWSVTDTTSRQQLYVTVGDNVGQSLKRTISETVGITETAPIKTFGRIRAVTETVGITEGSPLPKAIGKTRTVVEPLDVQESAVVSVVRKVGAITESVDITEDVIRVMSLRRVISDTVEISEDVKRALLTPTSTLQASALQLRYSGGTENQTTTSSRGGAMSNHSVTDNTMNNAWDDVLSAESAAGRTEYRCFYIYNTSSVSTAYNCELWVDLNTPAGDIIEIGVGSAATGGTEQDLTASAETEPPTGVNFSTAPDPDSAIPLEDIPTLSGRSIWIRRTVSANTPSWSDNLYKLRLSFYSDHTEAVPTAGFTSSGFLSTGFTT